MAAVFRKTPEGPNRRRCLPPLLRDKYIPIPACPALPDKHVIRELRIHRIPDPIGHALRFPRGAIVKEYLPKVPLHALPCNIAPGGLPCGKGVFPVVFCNPYPDPRLLYINLSIPASLF